MASTAVVTGATGFVATEVVKQLLEKGYTVHGTVRSLHNKDKVDHLLKLEEALPGTLKLHEADLLQEGSFDAAVSGADYVFHTASPFFIKSNNKQKDLIDPALKGTSNLMNSVARNKTTVKRVVLTSSVAAVHGAKGADPPKADGRYSEVDWNNTSTLEEQPYHLSKVLAEREAWKIAKEHGIDLVTILPNFVQGPVISSRVDGTSVQHMKDVLEGNQSTSAPIYVDVRDVAKAHVLAAETPSASGRYIVSQQCKTPSQTLLRLLQKRFPQYALAEGVAGEAEELINNSKAERELGLHLHPIESTFVDMAVTLIQVGAVTPKAK